ncbi:MULTISPECIES: SDR family oxidoreductase [unclassified Paenibacillus]|uniref:SDR family oxidoreductase n=1 Tax=unclassified Paenibacillus TaxID=185978 RepID=UPI001AE923A0|nr:MULTISPECIES: SDR family oxidoreductase [unclassified Paenibacillus]MBP1154046.1 NAD(P)-dependent dehydrogenase (short-subunit alcohol dehydrogenase family) [Paenibacillus sp. PvP091]MBP1170569.1 NAD(P)-dependent dehydrogenase (short-subunit alcohol dehydrogenase family) [Paenibacillus sp. PvR098]MBP2441597.1 NAD(P)-dependent dehydrogenase (short-subunit alcohol dehydrogenase family) [Paenibacillus sp. PvP052]
MGELNGKVAFITGAASGIGRAVAKRYVEEGAKVGAFDLDEASLDSLKEECGEDLITICGNVASLEDNKHAVAEVLQAFGKLDILIANAGVYDKRVSLREIEEKNLEAAYNKLFGVNVKGYLFTVKAALPALSETKGCIVMTASISSLQAGLGGTLYVASKHAIAGLVRQLALELSPDIRVNGVAIGKALTNLKSVIEPKVDRPSISAMTDERLPLKKVPLPEEVAGSYVFLASGRNAGHMTGTIILVDSGISVRPF